jgi:hypothetical protein
MSFLNQKSINMKRTFLAVALFISSSLLFVSCTDGSDTSGESDQTTESTGSGDASTSGAEVHGDLIKPGEVELTTPKNAQWVANGKSIYDVKCQSCHKLTDERVVGPGWKGITERREPHWIMNMITNVDVMLEQDPEAQKLLEQCLVRMPNQNLSREEARHVLEFMRSNDGVQ